MKCCVPAAACEPPPAQSAAHCCAGKRETRAQAAPPHLVICGRRAAGASSSPAGPGCLAALRGRPRRGLGGLLGRLLPCQALGLQGIVVCMCVYKLQSGTAESAPRPTQPSALLLARKLPWWRTPPPSCSCSSPLTGCAIVCKEAERTQRARPPAPSPHLRPARGRLRDELVHLVLLRVPQLVKQARAHQLGAHPARQLHLQSETAAGQPR
jgi:hypothetical protein